MRLPSREKSGTSLSSSSVRMPRRSASRRSGYSRSPRKRARKPMSAPGRRSEHDPVAVDGPDAELAHPPRLVAQRLDQLGVLRQYCFMERVDPVDLDVGEVRVISELVRGERVPTFAGHDEALVAHEETPAGVGDRPHLEPEHVAVVAPRALEVVHRDYIAWTSQLRRSGHRRSSCASFGPG